MPRSCCWCCSWQAGTATTRAAQTQGSTPHVSRTRAEHTQHTQNTYTPLTPLQQTSQVQGAKERNLTEQRVTTMNRAAVGLLHTVSRRAAPGRAAMWSVHTTGTACVGLRMAHSQSAGPAFHAAEFSVGTSTPGGARASPRRLEDTSAAAAAAVAGLAGAGVGAPFGATVTDGSSNGAAQGKKRKAVLTLTARAVERLRSIHAQGGVVDVEEELNRSSGQVNGDNHSSSSSNNNNNNNSNNKRRYLKIGTQQKGCSGNSYKLDIVEGPSSRFDEIVQQDGVQVIIDSKALLTIIGSEMDYVEDDLRQEFVFKNPNVKEMCGCGQSFVV